MFILPILNIMNSHINEEETYLNSYSSPTGQYCLEAYRTEPGATVDFSIKVYNTKDNHKTLIYNCYHEYTANIIWIDNSKVSINGKILDLSKNETFDWKRE